MYAFFERERSVKGQSGGGGVGAPEFQYNLFVQPVSEFFLAGPNSSK